MTVSNPASAAELHPCTVRSGVRKDRGRHRYGAMEAELRDALARERALLREKNDLLRRQTILAQEFEHRLLNSLQSIVSLLSLQSRAASTPEIAGQLAVAANRVAALARVHRRLHLHDHQEKVQLRQYVEDLCEDLSGLMFQQQAGHVIVAEGADVEVPAELGISLGFILNELITNAVKYAGGRITVHLETSTAGHSLSVLDDGPGLPAGFDGTTSKGLGMKIIQSLVKEIGGALTMASGSGGQGACITVMFGSSKSGMGANSPSACASTADQFPDRLSCRVPHPR